MMQRTGKLVFYLGWPLFWVYFRIWSERTRVLVVHDKKILLVKGWLSDGSWGLPGGGAHKREPLAEAATRELQEETGIVVLPSHLEHLEDIKHLERRLKYTAIYFLYQPKARPALIRQQKEIAEIGWFADQQLQTMKLNVDARYGVKKLVQENLL